VDLDGMALAGGTMIVGGSVALDDPRRFDGVDVELARRLPPLVMIAELGGGPTDDARRSCSEATSPGRR
jgi:hypothetical protein